MRSTAILEILQGVDSLDADAGAKQQFRDLIRAVGAAHDLAWMARGDRTAFARALLDCRVSRATIRDRLIAKFDVSRPQAYRIIGKALQLSQKQTADETHPGSNDSKD